eukprot:4004146-Lingulodinium_polyedra.AAC.1
METIRGMARRGFTPCNARPNTVEPWTPGSRNDFPALDSYVKTNEVAKGWALIDREFRGCFVANYANFR